MCEFTAGEKVVIRRLGRVGTVERMDDTPPGKPRRVVIAGVSWLASDVDHLISEWRNP